MPEKNCANCAYYNPTQSTSVLRQAKTEAEDFCSKYTTEPIVCATCQSYIIGSSFVEKIPNGWIEICANCAKALSTCAGCKHGAYCAFEQDPSPLPKIVTQTLKQGNAIMQTQVPNPERIRLLCEKCSCFSIEDKACNRVFSQCGNHISILSP